MTTKNVRRVLCAVWLACGAGSARPAFADDCATPVKSELKSLCGGFGGTLQADVAGVPGLAAQAPVKCAAGGTGDRVVVFARDESLAAQKPPSTRNGLLLDPNFPGWNPVSSAVSCSNLYDAVYGPPSGADSRPAAGKPVNSSPVTLKRLHDAINAPPKSGREAPEAAHDALKAYRAMVASSGGTVADNVQGTSTGLFTGAAEETLQILGTIVADRASAQAYALLKDKLEELLHCQPNSTSTAGFNATCKVLAPLRLQDIAMSRDAFMAALVSDGLSFIETKVDFQNVVDPILGSLAASVIVPLVVKAQQAHDDSAVRQIIDALVTYAERVLPDSSLTQQQSVVAVGVTAYVQCITPDTAADITKLLGLCDVGANVSKLAGSDTAILPAASLLAHDLVFMAMPTPRGGDVRPRIVRAVDAVFGTTCMLLSPPIPAPPPIPPTPTPAPSGTSPAAQTLPPTPSAPQLACAIPASSPIRTAQDALALAQPIIDDAIDGDTNAMIASLVLAMQYVNATLSDHDKRRVFAIIGGLLDYAATYTGPPASTSGSTSSSGADTSHDQRTKILESLTTMMTDRTGREGDVVASLGGSLRLIGGGRIGLQTSGGTFLGPVSLPLGVAITQIPGTTGCKCGVHVELDAVDLGQYLSWNKGPSVATPQAEDALSPSATIAVAFGPTMPFVVGATVGYSPSFVLDASKPDAKGTVNVGLVLGVDVPLIDLN
jgi:hypothetical protein